MIKRKWTKRILGMLMMGTALMSLAGCGSAQTAPADAPKAQGVAGSSDTTKEGQLCGLAESEEEAKKIADLYGIELVDYAYGLATFYTDEDPQKVIDEGTEKGYPQLTINGSSQLY